MSHYSQIFSVDCLEFELKRWVLSLYKICFDMFCGNSFVVLSFVVISLVTICFVWAPSNWPPSVPLKPVTAKKLQTFPYLSTETLKLLLDIEYSRCSRNKRDVIHVEFIQYDSVHLQFYGCLHYPRWSIINV